jgi:hypothetical protein
MAASEHPRLPRVGDEIVVRYEALVEVASPKPRMPRTWRYLAAGSRGRLIGWHEHSDQARAVVELAGTAQRLVVFVQQASVDRG